MATEMLKLAGTAVLCMAVTTAAAVAVAAAVSWLRSRRRRRICGVGVCEDCCGCDVALRHDDVAAASDGDDRA